jgi:hypothetical protein
MTRPKTHPPPAISVKTGLGESLKQGFGMGIGSSIGQRLVGAIFTKTTPDPPKTAIDCNKVMVDYDACVTTTECSSDVMRSLVGEMIRCQKEQSRIPEAL